MLSKAYMEKYADILLWGLKTSREGHYKKNEIVSVRYDLAAIRLAEILLDRLLDMGLNPVMRSGMTPAMERTFYKNANHAQLVFQGPWEKEMAKSLNGGIFLRAPASLTHLSDIDPKKIGKTLISQKDIRDILRKREEKGLYGWTLCTLPTEDLAKQAGLSLRQYANQIIRACYLDKSDPVRAWKAIYREAMSIKKWINNLEVKQYHIASKNTDLFITPGPHRRWIGISGHNIPSFELFVSPDWKGTEGVYYADQPSFRNGNYVEGVRLFFKNGVVSEVSAKKGEQFVKSQLSLDAGARRIGEFSLTDKRFSRINRFMANTLYDENYGGRYGNCHLALGSSYTNTYDGDPSRLTFKARERLGFNDSALHWDLVNTEDKTVTAHLRSGKKLIIYEKGIFRY